MTISFKDPVCGMEVHPRDAAGTTEYLGTRYYFCSLGCKAAFEEHPEQFRELTGQAHSHNCC